MNIDLSNNLNGIVLDIFKKLSINVFNIDSLLGNVIYRDTFLDISLYNDIKQYIPQLKKLLKSTFFTSTQKNASLKQNWPLLNLVRQILKVYNLRLEPKRLADGYTKDGIKKYKRLYIIKVIDNKSDDLEDELVNIDDIDTEITTSIKCIDI